MIRIEPCAIEDYEEIEELFHKLIREIVVKTTGDPALFQITDVLESYKAGLSGGIYKVFKAVDLASHQAVGFISLCESFALYADGSFGIIQELFVEDDYRSRRVGESLMNYAMDYGKSKKWKRLELCTPALPAFNRTLDFYIGHGFEVTGGKKLKKNIQL